jgi:hypothetical protein
MSGFSAGSGWSRTETGEVASGSSGGAGGSHDADLPRGGDGRASSPGSGDNGGGDDGDEAAREKEKSRKANPLLDLIETETAFVAELSKIIRVSSVAPLAECFASAHCDQPLTCGTQQRVAAAWSRTNFPPPELDTMFRNVESIYRVNRSFLKVSGSTAPQ